MQFCCPFLVFKGFKLSLDTLNLYQTKNLLRITFQKKKESHSVPWPRANNGFLKYDEKIFQIMKQENKLQESSK